jgi:hypothetical protein
LSVWDKWDSYTPFLKFGESLKASKCIYKPVDIEEADSQAQAFKIRSQALMKVTF